MSNGGKKINRKSGDVSKKENVWDGLTGIPNAGGLRVNEMVNDHLQIILTSSELLKISIQTRCKDSELENQCESLITNIESFSSFLERPAILDALKQAKIDL